MTDDFFRACIDQMIDLHHPLAVLASRLPWQQLEQVLPRALHGIGARPGAAPWYWCQTCSARWAGKYDGPATSAARGCHCG